MLFFLVAIVALALSLIGALMELGKLWSSQGLGYWGVGLGLLVPAIALFFAVERDLIADILVVPAKVAFLLLSGLGGAFIFHGVPHFFWQREPDTDRASVRTPEHASELGQEEPKRSKEALIRVAASIIVALLSLATAVVTLITKLISPH